MRPISILSLLTLFVVGSQLNAQNEVTIIQNLFLSSNKITENSTDAISLAVDAVWEASGITGTVTTTGTLTETSPGYWSYSSSPNDKLNLVFYNGNVVSFVFHQIAGYTQGTAEDFKLSHQMDFNTYIQNYMNMRVNSHTYPQNDTIYWNRQITGTAVYEGEQMNLNVNHNGQYYFDVSPGWALYRYLEFATGTSNTNSFSININEAYYAYLIHNSNDQYFLLNKELANLSSCTYGSTTYQYQNADVYWAAYTKFADSANIGAYNQVLDAHQWSVQGNLLKNGQVYGTLQFDGPVINNTPGPDLILHLNSGSNILLHRLIGGPVTDVENESPVVVDYKVMQNYPNPFNSSTMFRWNMKSPGNVSIKVYNQLGEYLFTVLDEQRPVGINEMRFEGGSLPSGIYFYRITTGEFSSVNKMVLIK